LLIACDLVGQAENRQLIGDHEHLHQARGRQSGRQDLGGSTLPFEHGVERIEGDLAAQALGHQDQRTRALAGEASVERVDHFLTDRLAAVALVDQRIGQAIVQQAVIEHPIEAGPLRSAFAVDGAVGGGSGAVEIELVFQSRHQRRPDQAGKPHRHAAHDFLPMHDVDGIRRRRRRRRGGLWNIARRDSSHDRIDRRVGPGVGLGAHSMHQDYLDRMSRALLDDGVKPGKTGAAGDQHRRPVRRGAAREQQKSQQRR
jgi:hypothetical protein